MGALSQPGGGVTVGKPVVSGQPFGILSVDASGNLVAPGVLGAPYFVPNFTAGGVFATVFGGGSSANAASAYFDYAVSNGVGGLHLSGFNSGGLNFGGAFFNTAGKTELQLSNDLGFAFIRNDRVNFIFDSGAGVLPFLFKSGGATFLTIANALVTVTPALSCTSTITSASTIKTGVFTVATLPAAATAGQGATALVSDALAPTFGAAVAGGGAVNTPVFSTGAAWNVG